MNEQKKTRGGWGRERSCLNNPIRESKSRNRSAAQAGELDRNTTFQKGGGGSKEGDVLLKPSSKKRGEDECIKWDGEGGETGS